MSYIEGIGDDVTILFTLLIILIFMYIAWLSTSVSDNPFIRVVVLDRARFQEFLRRFTQRIRAATQTNAPPETPNSSEPPTVTENVDTNTTENKTTHSGRSLSQTSTESINVSEDTQSDTQSDTQIDQPAGTQIHTQTNTHIDSETIAQNASVQTQKETITQSVLDSFLQSTRTSNVDQSESSIADNVKSQPSIQHTEPSTSAKETTSESSNSNPDGNSADSDCVLPSGESVTEQESQSGVELSGSAEPEEELLDGHIRIRLKYLDERQRLVQARPNDTIGQFKRENFSVELADNFVVRFIFRGQELREERSTLEAYNIEDYSVIHCLLTQITQPQQSANQQPAAGLDLGVLMFPLFGIILGLVWYCRIIYRNYFSAVSTLSLVGMTFLFVVGLMASRGRQQRHEHQD